jgi:hypothetical protein
VLRLLKVHQRFRCILPAVLTSSREDRDLKAAYDLGVNSDIEKPTGFNPRVEVAEQIERQGGVRNPCPH